MVSILQSKDTDWWIKLETDPSIFAYKEQTSLAKTNIDLQ
jgi:hypothetical protein